MPKDKPRSDFPGVAMIDVMIGMMLCFAVLLQLNTAAVKVEQAGITSHELFKIKVEWSGDSQDDVDTYVADPDGHLVYYKRLQDGLMALERDDTGATSNTVKLPTGEVVRSAFNEEVVDIRGIIPGEYVVNLHMYRKVSSEPILASVALYKGSIKAHEETVTLASHGDEKTAFRFTLTKDGDVVDINTLPKELVYQWGKQ